MRGFHWAAAIIAAVLVVAAPLRAAEDYPHKPVSVVLPFPPGGIGELVARPAMQILQGMLRQPFVIVNRVGAGGAIGNAFVAAAKPDGYTLLVTLSSLTSIPAFQKASGLEPAYRVEQLDPIALLTAFPQVLVARADGQWNSIQDLLADAKRRPDKITYASSGIYGDIHLAVEMLGQSAGVRFFQVPYQGGGPGVTALLSGQVDFTNTVIAAVSLIKAGKARALAVFGAKRFSRLPDVPTLKEAGHDVETYLWVGMFAPVGLPVDVMQRLREGMRRVAADETFTATLEKVGTPVNYMDAPEFKSFLQADVRRIEQTVARMGPIKELK